MRPASYEAAWVLRGGFILLLLTGCNVSRGNNLLPKSSLDSIPSRPSAAIFKEDLTGQGTQLADEMARVVESSGYQVHFIDTAALTGSEALSPDPFDLLVLPLANFLPVDSIKPVENFLKQGGNLIALGMPAWNQPVFRIKDQWLTSAECKNLMEKQKSQHPLFYFKKNGISRWERSSNNPASSATYELQPADSGKALHAMIPNMNGWETLGVSVMQPFPRGHSLTCFRAKGGPHTRQLALEWDEEDGSRWIATIPLTQEWKNYALVPEAFYPWDPKNGRGGPSDRLHVEKAIRFSVGMALSHTTGGHLEYWVTDFGTAPNPLGDKMPTGKDSLQPLETIAPSCLFYPITSAAELKPSPFLSALLQIQSFPALPTNTVAMQPRPQSGGYAQNRPWRWQPLIEARSPDLGYRGTIAALYVNAQGLYRGGAWLSFTPTETSFYRHPAIQQVIAEMAKKMREKVFLIEGGSEWFTAFEDQKVRLGARVANFGQNENSGLKLHIKALPIQADSKISGFEHEWDVTLPGNKEQNLEENWMPDPKAEGGYEITTELFKDGKLIDRLSHSLNIWTPPAHPKFMETRDGGFWFDGKPWKALGVNYMPSSGIGLNNPEYFEFWMGRGSYDPEIIERDLRRIKGMGMNAVSAFVYYQSLDSHHLLNFLDQCQKLNLKVNLSLRPGTPMEFRWEEMKALIEYYRLAQNDTVFAYDLAWEPGHFGQEYQAQHYSGFWKDWVIKRYGSWEAAEKIWKTASSSNSVPAMSQLAHDGPWRILVADYRYFLDDLLREKFSEARRLVRTLDPNHAVSFRMAFAGDPTHNQENLLPYDFLGLKEGVDIWEPEGYGRIGDWDQVKAGHFTAAYAHLCDPSKPVVWAEMGYNVWDLTQGSQDPGKLEFAGQLYHDFFKMLGLSGADGVFFWWYPGGFRIGENSDFGIIHCDGSDREVTRVIRREGPPFLSTPKPAAPDTWIDVDREQDARGLFGIYEAVKQSYWGAMEAGKIPGLKWKSKPYEISKMSFQP